MKKIILNNFGWFAKAWSWLRRSRSKAANITQDEQKSKILFIEDLPEILLEDVFYIVQDGLEPESLAFKCPCGCSSIIILNLLKDASPKWEFEITLENNLIVLPSIWRTTGCKSHFFVTDSKIKWV